MSALCRRFGISRKTGYKWLKRFEDGGASSLQDRRRTPRGNRRSMSHEVAQEILRLRRETGFGPKKLRVALLRRFGHAPAVSALARFLRRERLTEPKGRGRKRRWLPTQPVIVAEKPNSLWTVDFKGKWKTRDGKRFEPLTVQDSLSRFVLASEDIPVHSYTAVKGVFEGLFTRFGLPGAIRIDNGMPFACLRAPAGLTRLSAWWVRLGVRVERIQPGHPQQNGTHERMHLEIARAIERSPGADMAEENARLEAWRKHYNEARPHEALGMKTPAELYAPSPRRLPESLKPLCYPAHMETRKVNRRGMVRWRGSFHFLSESLRGHTVAIECRGDSVVLWFCNLCLGITDAAMNSRLSPFSPPIEPVTNKSCHPCLDNKV